MDNEDRYVACMVLHALGDTIGFNNRNWEFMKGELQENVLRKLYEFVDYGGVNSVPQKGWRISDDTVMHVKTANALLTNFNSINTYMINLTKEYLDAYDQFTKEGQAYREPGSTIMHSLKRLKAKGLTDEFMYDPIGGGSGAAMRCLCIGLAYHKKEDLQKLIQMAISSSLLTHVNAIGIIGGVLTALFTSFAIQGEKINLWMKHGFEIIESNDFSKIINQFLSDEPVKQRFDEDKISYLSKLKLYLDDKFDVNMNVIKKRSTSNLVFRTKYYYDNFGYKKSYPFPGSSGDDSIIISYDCLLDADDSWEKLVVYAMLHGGDTDTTGCISAGWWGAMKGFNNVPLNIMEHLEYKNELEKLGKNLYKKFK